MSEELRDLATKINEANSRRRNLTDADVNALSDALEKARGSSQTKALELASRTAVAETTTQLKRRIPNANALKNAIFNSNPIITTAVELFRKSSRALEEQEKILDEGNAQEFGQLQNQIDELRKNTQAQSNTEEAVNNSATGLGGLFKDELAMLTGQVEQTKFLLEEAVEQLKYANDLDETILDENRRSKLADLGVDEDQPQPVAPRITDNIPSDSGAPALDAGDLIAGAVGSAGLLATLRGLFAGNGIFSTKGKLLTGLKTVGKSAGRLLGPIAAIGFLFTDFIDGFRNAEQDFGAGATISERLQSAFASMVSGIFKPLDMAIEFFTGQETDIAGFIREKSLEFTGLAAEIVGNLIGSIRDFFTGALEGVSFDAPIRDIASGIFNNVAEMATNAFNSLRDQAAEGVATALESIGDINLFEGLEAIPQALGDIRDSISNAISGFFSETVDKLKSVGGSIGGFFDGINPFADEKPTSRVEQLQGVESGSTQTPRGGGLPFVEKPRPVLPDPQFIQDFERRRIGSESELQNMREEVRDLRKQLNEKGQPQQVIAPQTINATSQTSVIKSGMTTHSSIRQLIPSN